MTIRGLEDYLRERPGLVRELPLQTLRETRLGIDGSAYIEGLLRDNSKEEAFTPAVGGPPLTITATLGSHLKVLEHNHIKPVFVFDGLQPRGTWAVKREARAADLAQKLATREQAWDMYENEQEQEAAQAFTASNALTTRDLWRTVQRAYKHRSVENMTAPYTAAAQLLYLERHEKSYIHAVYGSTELLLYDQTDKLILGINWKAETFTFIHKRDVLNDLGLSPEQFLGLGLLAGCDYMPTFPALQPPHADFSFRNVVNLLQSFKSATAAIHYYLEAMPQLRSSNTQEHFARVRALIKFPLVLSANQGRVSSLPLALSHVSAGDIPHDLHDVFSHRLPDELYFQFWRGLFSSTTLDALVNGCWVDEAPLDGGNSEDYKRFLREIVTEHPQGPKAVSLGLMSNVLHPNWSSRPVHPSYYFDLPKEDGTPEIPYTSSLTKGVVERVNLWNVSKSLLASELARQGSTTVDLKLCLNSTAVPQIASATKTPRVPHHLLDKKDEVSANVLWRFLEIRGFLNNEHSHTAYAKALLHSLSFGGVNDGFQEPLFLALELIRAGVLHSGKFGGVVLSGGPSVEDDADVANMLLIIRTVSIVPIKFLSQAWDGPLSRELLVFNSFVKTLTRSLRTLIEATVVHLLLRGDAKRDRSDWLDIAGMLPFSFESNTIMGIIFKGYCDAVHYMTNEGFDASTVKEQAVSALQDAFGSGIRDIKGEVQRAFRFWDAVAAGVRVLKEEKAVSEEVAQQFEAADVWLKPLRHGAGDDTL